MLQCREDLGLGGILPRIHLMICLHAHLFSLTESLPLRFIIFSFDPYLTIQYSYHTYTRPFSFHLWFSFLSQFHRTLLTQFISFRP